MSFTEEAEKCRSQALAYLGKPEAPFLLRVARAFDQLESSRPTKLASRSGSSGL